MAIGSSRSRSELPELTVVGCAADPRVTDFQAALARRGWAPARIADYPTIAERGGTLFGVVRFESPGRTPAVLEAIHRAGISAARAEGLPPLTGRELTAALADRGRILPPRQFHLGLLRTMARVAAAEPSSFMNAPSDIALAFDKPRCQALLREHGVPVPQQLGLVTSYDSLRDVMAEQRCPRVFVKLNHGSAASGLVALEVMGDREQAWSTVELVPGKGQPRLYNTRRIQRYRTRCETRQLIDALSELGCYAERWVPKAIVDGRASDLRVVTVAGKPTHFVLRCARSPFTNLHLGGIRRDPRVLRERMPQGAWQAMLSTCRRVGRAFAQSAYLGLDVAITGDLRRHVVLEVNAFGDWIKGVFAAGQTPHDAELEAMRR